MKNALLLLLLLFALTCAVNAQPLTWPYVLRVNVDGTLINCTPQSCNQSLYVPIRGYGQVYAAASGYCVSGIRPQVSASFSEAYCSADTIMSVAAYVPGVSQLYVFAAPAPDYWVFFYAQQVTGEGYIWRNTGASWTVTAHIQQWSDCLTGAIRQYTSAPGGIC